MRRFKRTGGFATVHDGSGHRAGEHWGDAKDINPYSPVKKYSKNSPSFDEGVWVSKQKRKDNSYELLEKMKFMADKIKK